MSIENIKTTTAVKRHSYISINRSSAFCWKKKSIRALEEVMKSDKSIVLVAQKNSEVDDPQEKDIYSYGCLSKILQLLKLPDGTVKVLVEGLERVKIKSIRNEEKKYLKL